VYQIFSYQGQPLTVTCICFKVTQDWAFTACRGNFDNVDVFFLGAGDHRLLPHISMTAAYTHLLACYTLKGPDHADTRTALRQARNRDPQGWVPKLLGGIAFPPVSCAPAVAAGSRQEAWVRGWQPAAPGNHNAGLLVSLSGRLPMQLCMPHMPPVSDRPLQ
jgi:hypothetical protein